LIELIILFVQVIDKAPELKFKDTKTLITSRLPRIFLSGIFSSSLISFFVYPSPLYKLEGSSKTLSSQAALI